MRSTIVFPAMKLDDFQSWIETLRKQHFDISATAWRLLRLAAQYQCIVIRPQGDSALEIIIDNRDSRLFPIEHAIGKLRMILARIGSFYMESRDNLGESALYGFEGKMDLEDNFESTREFQIEMKNYVKSGEFYLIVKCTK